MNFLNFFSFLFVMAWAFSLDAAHRRGKDHRRKFFRGDQAAFFLPPQFVPVPVPYAVPYPVPVTVSEDFTTKTFFNFITIAAQSGLEVTQEIINDWCSKAGSPKAPFYVDQSTGQTSFIVAIQNGRPDIALALYRYITETMRRSLYVDALAIENIIRTIDYQSGNTILLATLKCLKINLDMPSANADCVNDCVLFADKIIRHSDLDFKDGYPGALSIREYFIANLSACSACVPLHKYFLGDERSLARLEMQNTPDLSSLQAPDQDLPLLEKLAISTSTSVEKKELADEERFACEKQEKAAQELAEDKKREKAAQEKAAQERAEDKKREKVARERAAQERAKDEKEKRFVQAAVDRAREEARKQEKAAQEKAAQEKAEAQAQEETEKRKKVTKASRAKSQSKRLSDGDAKSFRDLLDSHHNGDVFNKDQWNVFFNDLLQTNREGLFEAIKLLNHKRKEIFTEFYLSLDYRDPLRTVFDLWNLDHDIFDSEAIALDLEAKKLLQQLESVQRQREEFEKRLKHLDPCESLILGNLQKPTESDVTAQLKSFFQKNKTMTEGLWEEVYNRLCKVQDQDLLNAPSSYGTFFYAITKRFLPLVKMFAAKTENVSAFFNIAVPARKGMVSKRTLLHRILELQATLLIHKDKNRILPCDFLLETVKALIDHSTFAPNLVDGHGNTVLHYAALCSGASEIISLLLARGCDSTIKNFQGLSPLGMALHAGTMRLKGKISLADSDDEEGIFLDAAVVKVLAESCSDAADEMMAWLEGAFTSDVRADMDLSLEFLDAPDTDAIFFVCCGKKLVKRNVIPSLVAGHMYHIAQELLDQADPSKMELIFKPLFNEGYGEDQRTVLAIALDHYSNGKVEGKGRIVDFIKELIHCVSYEQWEPLLSQKHRALYEEWQKVVRDA